MVLSALIIGGREATFMADTVQATVKCGSCGTHLEWQEDVGDADHVHCKGCGMDCGTFYGINQAAVDTVAIRARELIKQVFKGR
jgi:hypothetical protein